MDSCAQAWCKGSHSMWRFSCTIFQPCNRGSSYIMWDSHCQVSKVLSYYHFQMSLTDLQEIECRFGHTTLEWGQCGQKTRYILLACSWKQIWLETSCHICWSGEPGWKRQQEIIIHRNSWQSVLFTVCTRWLPCCSMHPHPWISHILYDFWSWWLTLHLWLRRPSLSTQFLVHPYQRHLCFTSYSWVQYLDPLATEAMWQQLHWPSEGSENTGRCHHWVHYQAHEGAFYLWQSI